MTRTVVNLTMLGIILLTLSERASGGQPTLRITASIATGPGHIDHIRSVHCPPPHPWHHHHPRYGGCRPLVVTPPVYRCPPISIPVPPPPPVIIYRPIVVPRYGLYGVNGNGQVAW
jgi:hypothetical protein